MDIYEKYIRTINDFPIEGIKFRDITPLLATGDAFHQVIMDLNKELPSYDNWDKIIAAESRGFIFAAPLCSMNNKGLILARKAGKLPLVGYRKSYDLEYGKNTIEIPKDAIKPGDKVIIMDDFGIPVVSIVNYGLHTNDLLMINNPKHKMCKYKEKVNENEIKVFYEDGSEDIIHKNEIISIVQIEKNGRQTYIKYRD